MSVQRHTLVPQDDTRVPSPVYALSDPDHPHGLHGRTEVSYAARGIYLMLQEFLPEHRTHETVMDGSDVDDSRPNDFSRRWRRRVRPAMT